MFILPPSSPSQMAPHRVTAFLGHAQLSPLGAVLLCTAEGWCCEWGIHLFLREPSEGWVMPPMSSLCLRELEDQILGLFLFSLKKIVTFKNIWHIHMLQKFKTLWKGKHWESSFSSLWCPRYSVLNLALISWAEHRFWFAHDSPGLCSLSQGMISKHPLLFSKVRKGVPV